MKPSNLALIFLSTAFIAACGGGGGGSDPAPVTPVTSVTPDTPSGPSDAAINAAVDNAKTKISALMKDPASTTFQMLKTYRIGTDDTVCGEVNSKNSFGAYVGYKAFYYRPKTSSDFIFSQQTTTTGSFGPTVDAAAATLIATVCSNITSEQADAAQTAFVNAVLLAVNQ